MRNDKKIKIAYCFFKVKKQDVFSIIRTILHTLTISMRYEPANAKFFETEVNL